MSILSFPDRGPWGDSRWRGNCSGHIYRELFEQLKPQSFCDPMMGSGTSIEVAQEMNIMAFGLDLHMGFDCLRASIVERIGQQVELCVSNPPYGSQVIYSSNVWGSELSATTGPEIAYVRLVDDFSVGIDLRDRNCYGDKADATLDNLGGRSPCRQVNDNWAFQREA